MENLQLKDRIYRGLMVVGDDGKMKRGCSTWRKFALCERCQVVLLLWTIELPRRKPCCKQVWYPLPYVLYSVQFSSKAADSNNTLGTQAIVYCWLMKRRCRCRRTVFTRDLQERTASLCDCAKNSYRCSFQIPYGSQALHTAIGPVSKLYNALKREATSKDNVLHRMRNLICREKIFTFAMITELANNVDPSD